MDQATAEKRGRDWQRWRMLNQLDCMLRMPMAFLGLAWLFLLTAEMVWGLPNWAANLPNLIWGLFLLDFLLRLAIAPRKVAFLGRNLLTIASLVLPALRMARVLLVMRAARGVRLVQVLSSLNRGMRSARTASRRRGIPYVFGFTILVILVGAAGMYAIERHGSSEGFRTYSDSLWWTAMMITTMGTEFWPRTPEGRLLGFFLSVYAVGVFGYVTAALASFFVGQDKREKRKEDRRL